MYIFTDNVWLTDASYSITCSFNKDVKSCTPTGTNTLSDFQAWFLVYWASARSGSALDNSIRGSLSELVLDPRKKAMFSFFSHGNLSAFLQNKIILKYYKYIISNTTAWYELITCYLLLHIQLWKFPDLDSCMTIRLASWRQQRRVWHSLTTSRS